MDRLRAIQIFAEVARGRSFSAAAARLGMAKGNVTKHVKWLENQLGAQLLTRTTKSVSLTEAGMRLLEGGQDLLLRFDEIETNVRGAVVTPKGLIRVGAPPSFGAVHLVPLVRKFTERYPDIQFAIQLDDGRLDVARESLDLSVRIAPSLEDTSLVAMKLCSAPQFLVASPGYLKTHGAPRTLEDLLQHECLVNALKSPTGYWRFTGPEGKRSIRPSGPLRANFGEPLRHAALLGQGISMHPDYMLMRDLQEGLLCIVLPEYQPIGVDIYAVYPSRRNLPGRVRLFLEFLREELAMPQKWQTKAVTGGFAVAKRVVASKKTAK